MVKWVLAAVCVGLMAGCTWTPLAPLAASIETSPDTSQVTAVRSGGQTVIVVRSPTGIGRSRITLEESLPPGPLVFHLHVAGLEQFSLTYGDTEITAALAQSGDRPILTMRSGQGAETAVERSSAFWLQIAPPNPESPDRVIRIVAPDDLTARAPRVIDIRWVDFYR